MQGCCFGRPVSGGGFPGVHFPVNTAPAMRYPSFLEPGSVALHPVQLYESALNLLLCGVLLLLFKHEKRPGCIAGIYLVLYAAIRFTTEFFRGDHTDRVLSMTPSQAIALLIMLPLGVILYVCGRRLAGKETPREKADA